MYSLLKKKCDVHGGGQGLLYFKSILVGAYLNRTVPRFSLAVGTGRANDMPDDLTHLKPTRVCTPPPPLLTPK